MMRPLGMPPPSAISTPREPLEKRSISTMGVLPISIMAPSPYRFLIWASAALMASILGFEAASFSLAGASDFLVADIRTGEETGFMIEKRKKNGNKVTIEQFGCEHGERNKK